MLNPSGLESYQAERSVDALRLQNAARNRMEWFENVARYENMEPLQFAYSLLSGSQRIGHANLKLRDARFIDKIENNLAAGCSGVAVGGARFSPKHANFIENTGGATTGDVLELMADGRRRVLERFGVELEPEVQTLGDVRFPWR